MTFKPYPKYKASGVEWLGDVPEGWDVLALKFIVSMQSGEQITAEDIDPIGDYPVFGGNGLRGYTSAFTHEGPYALIGRQGALCGNVNYANGRFWASEHAVVVSPIVGCSTIWIGELLRTMNLGQYSITAAQPGLSVDAISKLRIPFAPPDEQSAIAAFLDRETAKIDILIAKQTAMIGLLKEKRQAVISHAVTKGLDPSAPMKSSGVEWLGDVPEHWTVSSLTRVTTSKCDGPFGSGLKSDHYTDSGARVVRLQNIKATHFHEGDAAYIDLKYFENDLIRHDVQEGDLLIAGLGDDKNLVGRACVAPPGIAPALVKADCFRFRLDLNLAVPSYIAFQLCCSASVDAGTLSTGSTRSRIPLSTMASRIVVLPPQEEQTKIVAYIDAQSKKFFALVARAEHAIALQKEHRTALISAAVTGKIDLRNENNLRKAA